MHTCTENSLRHINCHVDFCHFAPKIVELFGSLDGIWSPDLSKSDFVAKLFECFQSGGMFFVDEEDGVLKYVIVVELQSPQLAHFSFFFVNKDFWKTTKEILNELKALLHSQGVEKVRFESYRLQSSYERWVSKFGAKPISITYEVEV